MAEEFPDTQQALWSKGETAKSLENHGEPEPQGMRVAGPISRLLLAGEHGTSHYRGAAFLDYESWELQEEARGYFRYDAN